jgi:hypothetical protein
MTECMLVLRIRIINDARLSPSLSKNEAWEM